MAKANKKAIDLTIGEIIKISVKYGDYFCNDNCPLKNVGINCWKLCKSGIDDRKEIIETLEKQNVEFELED